MSFVRWSGRWFVVGVVCGCCYGSDDEGDGVFCPCVEGSSAVHLFGGSVLRHSLQAAK